MRQQLVFLWATGIELGRQVTQGHLSPSAALNQYWSAAVQLSGSRGFSAALVLAAGGSLGRSGPGEAKGNNRGVDAIATRLMGGDTMHQFFANAYNALNGPNIGAMVRDLSNFREGYFPKGDINDVFANRAGFSFGLGLREALRWGATLPVPSEFIRR